MILSALLRSARRRGPACLRQPRAHPARAQATLPAPRGRRALRRALMAIGLYTVPYLYVAYMWLVYRTSRVEIARPASRDRAARSTDARYSRSGTRRCSSSPTRSARHHRRHARESRATRARSSRACSSCADTRVFRGGSSVGRPAALGRASSDEMVDHMRQHARRDLRHHDRRLEGARLPDEATARCRSRSETGAPVGRRARPGASATSSSRPGTARSCRCRSTASSYVFCGSDRGRTSALPERGALRRAVRRRSSAQLCRVTAYARRTRRGAAAAAGLDRPVSRVTCATEMARAEEPVFFRPVGSRPRWSVSSRALTALVTGLEPRHRPRGGARARRGGRARGRERLARPRRPLARPPRPWRARSRRRGGTAVACAAVGRRLRRGRRARGSLRRRVRQRSTCSSTAPAFPSRTAPRSSTCPSATGARCSTCTSAARSTAAATRRRAWRRSARARSSTRARTRSSAPTRASPTPRPRAASRASRSRSPPSCASTACA